MTTGHLEASLLAEHAEGLLGPDDSAAVEAHLEECETCRATTADLASVSAMLAAAPPALPTPAHVVARLDRALTDEAAPAEEPAPVIQVSWFRRRAPQLLAAAATVSVVGLAGWVAATGGGGDDDTGGDASVEESAEQYDTDADAGAGAEDGDLETAEEEAAAAPLDADDGQLAIPVDEFESEIRAVAAQRQATEGGAEACGVQLADELAAELVGSAATDLTGQSAVLVVLQSDDPQSVHGWVLPACDASIDEALAELTVELD